MISYELMFGLLLLLMMKHFVVDFILQPPYMYLNKGKLLHPGGWLHAGLHALVSLIIFVFAGISFKITMVVIMIELLSHFFIDFTKTRINIKMGWHPRTPEFWYLLGLDQFLHYFIYWLMILIISA